MKHVLKPKFLISAFILVGTFIGGPQMAAAALPLTVEQERDLLFNDGTVLRDRLIRELLNAQLVRVTPKEALLRNRIAASENNWRQLLEDFLIYDRRVSDFVQRLATAQNTQTPQGAAQPISLNTQFQFAIYTSQLSAHRETIRSILRDINELISSRRSQANAVLALIVSLASVFVALFIGIINLMAR